MKKLHILPTENSPEILVDLKKSYLLIKGKSVPENSFEFYKPVLEYISNVIDHGHHIKYIDIDLHYFNSNSSKIFLDILLKISKTNEINEIRWLINKNDQEMKEAGEDYMAILGLSFKIIEK